MTMTFTGTRAIVPGAAGLGLVLLLLAGCSVGAGAQAAPALAPDSARVELRDGPTAAELDAPTRVVILGTGTPIPDANRAGASVAIVHRGEAYLFDVGAGAVHNATRARYRHDLPSLYPSEIDAVFLTHMHSDHTADFAELATSLWWRRREQLLAFGPTGLRELADGMVAMMQPDIRTRSSGGQPLMAPEGYRPVVTEISAGVVFERGDLRVEAFDVPHGDIRPAFGYRVTTDDLRVVISGDTAYSETVRTMAEGADILIHEFISTAGLELNSPGFQAYHRASHTTTEDLARLAGSARPGLLVLYHGLHYGLPESVALEEVRAGYDGEVVLANDLDLFQRPGSE
jgi:ribonuclease BN (tRNA processing enzyme)